MPEKKRILIGGVPFGCDNVGDEAILECGVAIIRAASPGCAITVCTKDGAATAKKLGVETCDLLGFAPYTNRARIREIIAAHDAFVWCGATGLSDYPEIPLGLLEIAQAEGKATVLWGVGMNRALNPALYRLWPGKRRTLLNAVTRASLGQFDAVAFEEHRWQRRARRKIAKGLNAADLVVVRDADSREEAVRSGVTRDVIVGMDSALELTPVPVERIALPENASRILNSTATKVGICISAQRKVQDEERLLDYLNRITARENTRIVFVPMNPVTDAQLMAGLREKMKQPERAAVLEGRYEPGEVLGVVSHLDAIVSSRLHLLIFSAIVEVPFVGISRGSKVDSFLKAFGLESAGEVESLSFDALFEETLRVLSHREDLAAVIRETRRTLQRKLEDAKPKLREALHAGRRA